MDENLDLLLYRFRIEKHNRPSARYLSSSARYLSSSTLADGMFEVFPFGARALSATVLLGCISVARQDRDALVPAAFDKSVP